MQDLKGRLEVEPYVNVVEQHDEEIGLEWNWSNGTP